jgi:hypothetical protein
MEHDKVSVHEKVIVFEVDSTRCETREHELTGAQIKALAKKPAANTLYQLEERDGRPYRREIGDAESVHLHDGDRFMTAPPVGKTS